MGMDAGGPSSAHLSRSAGNQGVPPDVGQAMAGGLHANQLAHEQRYAAPTIMRPHNVNTDFGDNINEVPTYYNRAPAPPVKYDVPTAQKERLSARQAVRQSQPSVTEGAGTVRIDPISEEEVDYQQHVMAQKKLADFDKYVNTLIDPRKPGNLKWLMDVYPDFVKRRIQQAHTDYEYALHNQMIDQWGINTFEDLHFKYLVDQGLIDGPQLNSIEYARDHYEPGWLSPYSRLVPDARARRRGIRLPFASANWGRQARNEREWVMEDDANPTGYVDYNDMSRVAAEIWRRPIA